MQVEHVPASASVDTILEILRRDAVVVVDDLASTATVDAIVDEMAPHLEATPPGTDDFAGRNTRRCGALVARSPTARDLVMHETILGVTGGLLHRAANFQLHLTQVIAIGPGSPAQAVHRDQWAFDFFPFPADYDVQCNTIWALTDFTEENGATRVIPGSQAWPDRLDHHVDETIPAEMTKGSCLLYTGKVYHGGGENRSDHVRMGCNITYDVAWLRQEENQYLSVPHEIATTLPDDLLRLLGYRIGAYALGYVDDVRDPLDVLRGRPAAVGFGDLALPDGSGAPGVG